MDKRKQANLRVRIGITEALLRLMRAKPFPEITISEITRAAGVARASFYRNYSSKEDVLFKLIDDVLDEYRAAMDSEKADFYNYTNIYQSFLFFLRYREPALQLYHCGYGSTVLEKLNRFHEEVAGYMPISSIERYKLYMYIGCLFNTAITWLQDGAKETPAEMARLFCHTLNRFIPIDTSAMEENDHG